MSNKLIYEYKEIKDEILKAVDIITDPIRQTMSPKGGNVIYEDDRGDQYVTMDGVTIAKNITVADPVHNAIIEIIKDSSLKTNMEAGDGTSSTILLSSILIKGGLSLVDKGHNQMEIKEYFDKFAVSIKKQISKYATQIETDEDLFNIANVSSNNDSVIAKDVVETIKVVGEEGQVLINKGYEVDTEIIKDNGFIGNGIFVKEIAGDIGKVSYEDVPVFITDKRIYYKQEAQTLLSTAIDSGHKSIVIVASDFIGEALPYLVANHQQGVINVLLIKESNVDKLHDIATYLNGSVVSDKNGDIVNNITDNDMYTAKMVYADQHKSIISRDETVENKALDTRIKMLEDDMKEVGNKNSMEYNNLKNRLSSLTRGMVTLKVGGHTQLEVIERIFRYEDAINATRSAMSEGYLPGGGVAIFQAFNSIEFEGGSDYNEVFKDVCSANIRQIAINCGEVPEMTIEKIKELPVGHGYNAVTGEYEDMVSSGIIEPLKVLKQVIDNAVSIANVIVTSRYLIINDLENIETNNK